MNTVRFGVVGVGGMGSGHINYMNTLQEASLAAVCDVDAVRADAVGKKHNVKSFSHFDEMFKSGAIDAVLIATPHYQHPDVALAAFERGIHVLCEKPMAVSVSQARKVIEAHTKKYSHLKFGMMFQQRTAPFFQKLRQLIADGELGELYRITWIQTDWFRANAYYASSPWRATWAGEGGGVLINQAPHNLDMIQWVTGLMPKRITAVGFIAKRHPIEVEDEISAIMEYDNGAVGHFITTTGECPGVNRLEITGDRGRIVAEDSKLTFFRMNKSVAALTSGLQEIFPSASSMENWKIDVPIPTGPNAHHGHSHITQNFVKAILHDAPLLAPGNEGDRQLELSNAMLMAGITRKAVDLPVDGAAYDAFIADMTQKYGGQKIVRGHAKQ